MRRSGISHRCPKPAWIRDRPVQIDILTPATTEELRMLRELEIWMRSAEVPGSTWPQTPADILAALDRHREGS